jgi:hypothetical protein
MSGDDDDMLERIFETVGGNGEPVCGKCFSNAIGVLVNQTPQG